MLNGGCSTKPIARKRDADAGERPGNFASMESGGEGNLAWAIVWAEVRAQCGLRYS